MAAAGIAGAALVAGAKGGDNVDQINIKILILGPLKSGKTSIANYLADSQDPVSKENYRATQGRALIFASLYFIRDVIYQECGLWNSSRINWSWRASRSTPRWSFGTVAVTGSSRTAGQQFVLEQMERSSSAIRNSILVQISFSGECT